MNAVPTWLSLLYFPRRCLRVLSRGGCRWSLATLVNHQISEECDPPSSNTHSARSVKISDPVHLLASKLSEKLEDGTSRGAVHLACSDDSVAAANDATATALREKHPAPHPDLSMPPGG